MPRSSSLPGRDQGRICSGPRRLPCRRRAAPWRLTARNVGAIWLSWERPVLVEAVGLGVIVAVPTCTCSLSLSLAPDDRSALRGSSTLRPGPVSARLCSDRARRCSELVEAGLSFQSSRLLAALGCFVGTQSSESSSAVHGQLDASTSGSARLAGPALDLVAKDRGMGMSSPRPLARTRRPCRRRGRRLLLVWVSAARQPDGPPPRRPTTFVLVDSPTTSIPAPRRSRAARRGSALSVLYPTLAARPLRSAGDAPSSNRAHQSSASSRRESASRVTRRSRVAGLQPGKSCPGGGRHAFERYVLRRRPAGQARPHSLGTFPRASLRARHRRAARPPATATFEMYGNAVRPTASAPGPCQTSLTR